MVASTNAWYLLQQGLGGAGVVSGPSGATQPEEMPAWLWGQGTPAAIVPFTTVNKGSLYSEVNATDDDANLWVKRDEGSDAADWVRMGDSGVIVVKTELFDISAVDFEKVVFHAVGASEILEAGLLWNQASAASGLEGGDITIGTASGGAQIVAALAYSASQASGAYTALTLVDGALAAGTSVFAHHDIASGAAGTFFLIMKIRMEA